ncbi:hypothetical protein [Paraliobacillus sp. X-1268]|uniref:hypothetical protein n=1 Tax=Paraliobacillus sp. X-1268 TaxID=2213193 RepID=UPI0035133C4E
MVFVREKDARGLMLYQFKGEYEINTHESYQEGCLVWNRIAVRVKTYLPKE